MKKSCKKLNLEHIGCKGVNGNETQKLKNEHLFIIQINSSNSGCFLDGRALVLAKNICLSQ